MCVPVDHAFVHAAATVTQELPKWIITTIKSQTGKTGKRNSKPMLPVHTPP
jgi:hypothetical protein